MNKCKEILVNTALLLTVVLILALVPTEKEGAIYEDTVRLHILANSDSRSDQELKLKIRDKVLNKYGERLSEAMSKEDAEKMIRSLTDDIKLDVDVWLAELGTTYKSSVELVKEWYDTRNYEGFTLPSGYYTSLKIMLGEGDGQNWWCVMYPPLCLDVATANTPTDDALIQYSKEEVKLITNDGYNVKFKILELLSESIK